MRTSATSSPQTSATRSGGHYATLYTHIDDFVESTRVVTPAGTLETRRLPGSGAGPSQDRMFIGSEGILGIITEAWVRLRKKPTFRASASVRFKDFHSGADAVREITQAGLYPANCRLLEADIAAQSSKKALIKQYKGLETAREERQAAMTAKAIQARQART